MSNSSICILPHFRGLGGPASFQNRLIAGLTARGIEVVYDPNEQPLQYGVGGGGDFAPGYFVARKDEKSPNCSAPERHELDTPET